MVLSRTPLLPAPTLLYQAGRPLILLPRGSWLGGHVPGEQNFFHPFSFFYPWDCDGVSGGDKQSWVSILENGGRRLQGGRGQCCWLEGVGGGASADPEQNRLPSSPAAFDVVALGPSYLCLRLPWR